MGYRHYIYEVDKTLVENIRNCKTHPEFINVCKANNVPFYDDDDDECDPWICLYNLGKELFEFGKHYENADEMYKRGDTLFSTEELNERYFDYSPIIIDKDGLACAIEWQKNKILSLYKDLMREESEDKFDKRGQFDRMKSHIDDYLFWLERMFVLDLDNDSEHLTKSWLYEHTIFDLIRIYKTFDWENKCMMFMGW